MVVHGSEPQPELAAFLQAAEQVAHLGAGPFDVGGGARFWSPFMTVADRDRASAFERFKQQRWRAANRGLGWEFTFEQWLEFWMASGKWHLRGKGTGKYVMARRGDVGPYSPGNCFICPFEQNISDGHLPARPKPTKPPRQVRGWTYRSGPRFKRRPFQVMHGDRYVGSFASQTEAESAYQQALLASSLFFCLPSVMARGGNSK